MGQAHNTLKLLISKKMKHKEKDTSKETKDSQTLIKDIKIILWMNFNN